MSFSARVCQSLSTALWLMWCMLSRHCNDGSFGCIPPQVSDVPVNCVAFDQLGTRFFAGDAAGMLTELSVDLTPLSAPGSTWSNTWSNTTQAGWASVSAAGAGSSSSSMAGSPSSGGAAGSGSGSAGAVSTEGLSTSGAGAGISSVLKHGSNALQQLAGLIAWLFGLACYLVLQHRRL